MNRYAPPLVPVDLAPPPADAELRVSFRNSFSDLALLQLWVQFRSPVFLAAAGGFGILIAVERWAAGHQNLFSAVAVCVAVVVVTLLLNALFVLVFFFVHRDRNYFRDRTIELSESAVIDTTDLTRYEAQWPAVHGVSQTPWCLYIRLAPHVAHCIPRRAFEDTNSYERFASAAVHRFNLAGPRP